MSYGIVQKFDSEKAVMNQTRQKFDEQNMNNMVDFAHTYNDIIHT